MEYLPANSPSVPWRLLGSAVGRYRDRYQGRYLQAGTYIPVAVWPQHLQNVPNHSVIELNGQDFPLCGEAGCKGEVRRGEER